MSVLTHDPVLTLDPTNGVVDADGHVLAVRPATLAGQTLGIIANGIGHSDLMFNRLQDCLVEVHGVRDVVKVVKLSVSVPPSPEQWLAVTDKATVAITGFGGCGSCSTRSVRDALDLEAIGIPAVCIVHEALLPGVRAIARFLGAPDYPVVTLGYPHDPTAHWTEDEAQELAVRVSAVVADHLTA